MKVALDGPAGAGKSSVAKEVARVKGYIYVDTGAMYRTIGLYCLRNNIDVHDRLLVGAALDNIHVDMKYIDGVQHMYLNGEDVSEDIRTPEGGMAASAVSAIPAVRSYLLNAQREMADKYDVVMDGRDIGTVILPDAECKIFLTASVEERAKRRALDFEKKGIQVNMEELIKDIKKRDYDDSHRAIAPLKQAEDAVLIDTSNMDFTGVVQAVLFEIEKREK